MGNQARTEATQTTPLSQRHKQNLILRTHGKHWMNTSIHECKNPDETETILTHFMI